MVANSKVKPQLSKVGFVLLGLAAIEIVMAPVKAKDKSRKKVPNARSEEARDAQQTENSAGTNLSTLPPRAVDINVYVDEAFCSELKLAGFWSMKLVSRGSADTTRIEKRYVAFGFDPYAKQQIGFLILEGDQMAQSFKYRFDGNEKSLRINLDLGHEKLRGEYKIAEDGGSVRIVLVSGSDIGAYTALKLKKLTSPRLANSSPYGVAYDNPQKYNTPMASVPSVGSAPQFAPIPQS